MKITCISTSRIPSDTANSIQVMKACHALAQLGHEVQLLVPELSDSASAGGRAARSFEALAEHYGLSTPFEIAWLPADPRFKRNDFAWRAVRRAAAQHAALVYTWTGQSAVFALLQRLPVAYEIHDLPTGRIGPLWFRAFTRLPGRKRLLPITQALRRALAARFSALPSRQVVLAPNGVDLEQYADLPSAPEARRQLALPSQPTVLCAGHLYAGRGATLFMDLARQFSQVSFVWVGGRSEDVSAYRQEAERAGLHNATFTGFVSNRRLPCYQAAADVLLMPYARTIAGSSGGNSADICSPMKMFDYLAAGRAILSSDLPVIHEILHENNARFAQPEDLPDWSAALARLLSDENLRLRLGAQARSDAVQYTWRARAARILASFSG